MPKVQSSNWHLLKAKQKAREGSGATRRKFKIVPTLENATKIVKGLGDSGQYSNQEVLSKYGLSQIVLASEPGKVKKPVLFANYDSGVIEFNRSPVLIGNKVANLLEFRIVNDFSTGVSEVYNTDDVLQQFTIFGGRNDYKKRSEKPGITLNSVPMRSGKTDLFVKRISNGYVLYIGADELLEWIAGFDCIGQGVHLCFPKEVKKGASWFTLPKEVSDSDDEDSEDDNEPTVENNPGS